MLQAVQAAQQQPASEGTPTMILTPEAWGAATTGTTAVQTPSPAPMPVPQDTVYTPPKTQPATRPPEIQKPQPKTAPAAAAAAPARSAVPARANLQVKPTPSKGGVGKWIAIAAVLVICALV